MLRQIQPVWMTPQSRASDTDVPNVSLSWSFSEFQRFESRILECVATDERCAECQELARYIKSFRQRPHLVRLSWNGSSVVNPDALREFLRVVAAFASRVAGDGACENDAHQRLVSAAPQLWATHSIIHKHTAAMASLQVCQRYSIR